MKTIQEVRQLLSVIEPDERTYAQIDNEDIPQLQILLKDGETWLGARAVLALSRLKNELAYRLIKEATTAKRNELRVAVAVGLRFLPDFFREEILGRLLSDDDLGVKRMAIYSIPDRPNKSIRRQLQLLSVHDKHDYIKTISREKLSIIQY